jgi:hypothetical protein
MIIMSLSVCSWPSFVVIHVDWGEVDDLERAHQALKASYCLP